MSTENGKAVPEPEGYRGIQVYIEKKIRNLEKKKNRLDDYQKRLNKGETLEPQQKDALASMTTVQCNLEFARDVLTHVTQTITDQERQAKKAEKRAKIERDRRELELLENLARLQALLVEMGSEEVKAAFSHGDGVDGIKLTEKQLESLDQLYQAITPAREPESSVDVAAQSWPALLRSSAECSQYYLEAREDKRLPGDGGDTYRSVSELVKRLAALPFFTVDKQPTVGAPPPQEEQPQASTVAKHPVPASHEEEHHQLEQQHHDEQQPSGKSTWSQQQHGQWADEPMPCTPANGSGFQTLSAQQPDPTTGASVSDVAAPDADGFIPYSRSSSGGRGSRGGSGGFHDGPHGGRGGGGGGFRGGERGGFRGGERGGGGFRGGERGGRSRGGGFGGDRGGRGGGGGGRGGGRGGFGGGERGGFGGSGGERGGFGGSGGERGGFGGGGGGFRGRSSYARHNSFGMSEQPAQE